MTYFNKSNITNRADIIPIFFGITCILLLSCQLLSFNYLTDTAKLGTCANIISAIAQSAIIISPYFILNGKWRGLIILPMIIIPIFLYANILYFRDFNDLMGFHTMFGVENANGDVLSAAFSSYRHPDLFIIIPVLIFILSYILLFKKFTKGIFSKQFKIYAFNTCLLLFVLSQCYAVKKIEKDFPKTVEAYKVINSENFFYNKFQGNPRKYRMAYYSFVPYVVRELFDVIKSEYRKPTKSEQKAISDFMTKPALPLLPEYDSLPGNSQKNLIMIIVESFDSDLLYMSPNSKPALPKLWKIINEAEHQIILDNVIPQIGQGRSSDGQFIYNTGIIPNPTTPVAMAHPNAKYPSLARAFNRNARAFDIGNPLQWNKVPMAKSYGYIRLHTDNELHKNMKVLGGRDAALFTNSLPIISKMKQPFLATLCTMDMHDPYDVFGWHPSDAWTDKSFSGQERIYIEKGRQFDNALDIFVQGLKDSGLYENTIIAILSDHTARENRLTGTHFTHPRIPAIILNSGMSIRSSVPLLQTDIYPTLLDLTGRSGYEWRGFGTSVLRNPSLKSGINYNLTDSISTDPVKQHLADIMMETGYWRK